LEFVARHYSFCFQYPIGRPFPAGLLENELIGLVTEFQIPEPLKNKPLLLSAPASPCPIEIKINKYLVLSSGIMTSKTVLDKFFSEWGGCIT